MEIKKPIEIDRKELYELVWQVPRTELTERFGISDVAIGKHCRNANIPMPTPGYWAKVKSGTKLGVRLRLPPRSPGQPQTVTMGNKNVYFRPAAEDELIVPSGPPEFFETVDEIVAPAIKKIGKVSACRDLSNPYPGLNKILASETKRREKNPNSPYSFDKPHFDAPHYQRQLRIFNSLLLAVDRIGESGYVSKSDEWTQGYGIIYSLSAALEIGEARIWLEFLEPSSPKKAN